MTRGPRIRSTKMAVHLHGTKTEDDDEEDTLAEDRQNAGMASVEPDPSLPSNEIKTYPQVSNDENNEKDSSDAGRNELACPRCSKLFKSNNGLKGHLGRNSEMPTFYCFFVHEVILNTHGFFFPQRGNFVTALV